MTDTKDPTQAAKPATKTVPLSDLMTIKTQLNQMRSELAETKTRLATAEGEAKIVKTGNEDEEGFSKIKQFHLDREKDLNERQAKLEGDETAFGTRERAVSAKEIVADLRQKGVETNVETLLAEEDMSGFAHTAYVEHLAKENEELKKKTETSSSVFDTAGAGGVVKKGILDQTTEEFAETEKRLKAEALPK